MRRIALLTALMLCLAGAASAASISLEWAGTGGSGTVTSPGTYTLDIVVTADSRGISLVHHSIYATGGAQLLGMVTNFGGTQECISPPNLATGLCFVGGGALSPSTLGVGALNADWVRWIEAGTVGTGPTSASFVLAQAIVNLSSAGNVWVAFTPGDGVFDNAGADITDSVRICSFDPCESPPPRSPPPIPEPATALLLAAGLLALGAHPGRRA